MKHQTKHNNWETTHHHGLRVQETNPFIVVGQILTIIIAVFYCLTIIGMIWGIPMIIGCNKRLNGTKKITIMHIVITLIFYAIIPGILTLFGAAQDRKI